MWLGATEGAAGGQLPSSRSGAYSGAYQGLIRALLLGLVESEHYSNDGWINTEQPTNYLKKDRTDTD